MLKISEMSGKLLGIPAINTNTLTNEFCLKMHSSTKKDSICSKCYSFKMLESYRANCAPAWQKNSEILSRSIIPVDFLPVTNVHSFRFDGHGELINLTHYFNLIRIARKNKDTHFALWTKRKDLIKRAAESVDPNSERPKNLILVYSNPTIDRIRRSPPKYFDKVFNNTSTLTSEDNCSGRTCLSCQQCYRKDSGINVIIEQVK